MFFPTKLNQTKINFKRQVTKKASHCLYDSYTTYCCVFVRRRRMGNFEAELFTVVDTILELLGETPRITRSHSTDGSTQETTRAMMTLDDIRWPFTFHLADSCPQCDPEHISVCVLRLPELCDVLLCDLSFIAARCWIICAWIIILNWCQQVVGIIVFF